MIVARYQWRELGELHLDRTEMLSGHYGLDLSLGEGGDNIGEVFVLPDEGIDAPDGGVLISDLGVKEGFRGWGLGSLLMGEAVKLASALDMQTVRIGLGNERTLSSFCSNFAQEDVTFYRRPTGDPRLVRLPGGEEQVRAALIAMRLEQFPDALDSTEQLAPRPRQLYAKAVLA